MADATMPTLRVWIELPYSLLLQDGDYRTSPSGEAIQVKQAPLLEGGIARTCIYALFDHPDVVDLDEKERLRSHDIDQLLRRTNRLLRWYRAVSGKSDVIELTRAQAGEFHFEVVGTTTVEGWDGPVTYEEAGPAATPLTVEEVSSVVAQGLATGGEPLVADLFPIDAERALYDGRFREAVLLSWSTIDAVFNRKYDALVNAALEGEWRPARDFFTGVDFGLRNKMTAVMHLVANRSLFREPSDLWTALSKSYDKRNAIIHRGENATEDEAYLALDVARRIIRVMDSL